MCVVLIAKRGIAQVRQQTDACLLFDHPRVVRAPCLAFDRKIEFDHIPDAQGTDICRQRPIVIGQITMVFTPENGSLFRKIAPKHYTYHRFCHVPLTKLAFS